MDPGRIIEYDSMPMHALCQRCVYIEALHGGDVSGFGTSREGCQRQRP